MKLVLQTDSGDILRTWTVAREPERGTLNEMERLHITHDYVVGLSFTPEFAQDLSHDIISAILDAGS
jgi:hypothetical protein